MIKQILNSTKAKIFIFIIFFDVFCALSFAAKSLLVSNFNKVDFGLVSIEFIKNYGAAFSLFNSHTKLLIVISLAILLAIAFYIIKNIKNFCASDVLFTAMLCAGIICNMTERIIDGYVTDYIKLTFVSFPIFNLSDVFITTGAFVLICNILFNNEKQ